MAKKILTQATYDVDNVQQLPVQVKGQASLVQQTFDKSSLDQKTYNNNTLLSELQSETANDSGAHAIGLGVTGITANNVGDGIKEVKDSIDGVVLGQIPNGSLTRVKLDSSLQATTGMQEGTVLASDVTLTLGTLEYGQTFEFYVTSDVSSATINTVTCKDIEGNLIDLEANTVYVGWLVDDTVDFFVLAPRGSGGEQTFLQQYDGTNQTLLDSKLKPTKVKAGDYVVGEFYDMVINYGGSNPNFNTWDLTIPDSTDKSWVTGIAIHEGFAYVPSDSGFSAPYQPLRYDIENRTWNESLTGYSTLWSYPVASGSKLYCSVGFEESYLAVYDIPSDSWSNTSSSGFANVTPYAEFDGVLYCHAGSGNIATYDTSTGTWNNSLTGATKSWKAGSIYNKRLYALRTDTNAIIVYDIDSDSWDITGFASPVENVGYTSTIINGEFFIGSNPTRRIIAYNIKDNVWDESLSAITYAHTTSVASYNYKCYATVGDSFHYIVEFDSNRYEQQIIPPITKATGSQNVDASETKILMHFDEDIVDEQGRTWTNNGATFDTVNKVFGSASINFDGGDWIDTTDSDDFNFGNGDFTIDFRIARNAVSSTNERIAGQGDSSATSANASSNLYLDTANKIKGIFYYSGGSSKQVESLNAIDDLDFHHVAYVRHGDSLYLFLDGVKEATTDVAGITFNDSAFKFAIGRWGEWNSQLFNGKIDEFRIVKGVAVWINDFDLPTEQYNLEEPSKTNNKALIDGILQMNNPELGQVYEGFVSKANRWLPSMDGGRPEFIKHGTLNYFTNPQSNTVSIRASVSGSGKVKCIASLGSNSYWYVIIDGTRYPSSNNFSLQDSTLILDYPFENSFEFYSNDQNTFCVYELNGSLSITPPSTSGSTTQRVSVSGKGRIKSILPSQYGSLEIDGVYLLGTSATTGKLVSYATIYLDIDYETGFSFSSSDVTGSVIYEEF